MSRRVLTLVGILSIVFRVAWLPEAVAQDLERWSPKPDDQTQTREGKSPPTACEGCLPKTAKPKAWKTPRTPWGDPDLQGIWNDATITPFQRPSGRFGEKDVLDDEDAEEILETISRDRRDGRGTPEDVDRAYNDHWMDHGTVVPDKRTSLITDPPDGRIPPLTPEAQRKIAAAANSRARFLAGLPYGPEDFSLAVRCVIRQDVSPYRPSTYNATFQIFQSPGYVVVAAEMIHSARIIPLDRRPHLGPTLRQWLGDTRGHWEGNTLVVETINFRSDSPYAGANADTFQIVERFTLVDDTTIDYEFRINDPKTWTKPWAGRIPWNRTTGQVFEYACHESNYDVMHLLSGARIREKNGEVAPAGSSR